MTARIAIVGAGEVGAATAYALLRGSLYSELLLVDVKPEKRDGQVRDLSDACCAEDSTTRVRAGTVKEAGECDIVVITAGSKRTRGETSLQLIERNTAILERIIDSMRPFRSDLILIVVSHPVDVLTTLAQKLSGLPKSQVIGSGTFLDTVRLRRMLADKYEIAPGPINAYVLGEHGDSQFVAWSHASIDGVPIDEAVPPREFSREALADECKREGQRIVDTKGAIAFGIASVVASICAAVLFDRRDVRPVSHFQPELGCCVSMPVVLGRHGVVKPLPLPLSAEEKAKLAESATVVREATQKLLGP
ncbi:L-lactate dehydrogenase [Cladophialophora immunda]|uniref:L-lactate dehydrogenase n=2 Tax=Eurotiomycetes TaxID=147545 RepID=A0A0D2C199_9EURO|nr:L-lactate dehydrogenase [Cladophialophora immunda]KIW25063.1 L-lactate dehydrogenase [Cladophialophora immunda]OQU96550.1 lactate/malate dehydrogenase, alpha/beta domain-containing protein isoform 2 [Cladophialophora immunda]